MPRLLPLSFAFATGLLIVFALSTPRTHADDKLSQIDALLTQGEFTKAAERLEASLREDPDDSSRHMALGVTRLAIAYHDTIREFAEFGARFDRQKPPQDPPKVDYRAARRLMRNMRGRFDKALESFEAANDPKTRFPVHFGAIPLDLDGDGVRDERISVLLNRGRSNEKIQQELFVLDRSDALLMEAHCHAVLGILNFSLGYDWSETFGLVGHAFFWNAQTEWDERLGKPSIDNGFRDAIAAIHVIRWPLQNKRRLRDALKHAEAFAESLSQVAKSLSEEDDDDRELIAGPQQTAVVRGLEVSQANLRMMEETAGFMKRVLSGKTLLPRVSDIARHGFYRGENKVGMGVNVRRVFLEPRRFDLVLWIHGSAATPYLEEGEVEMEIWRSLQTQDWARPFQFFHLP